MSSTLLYTLRSPTTPLAAKLALARAALDGSLAPLEAAQLRDWTLDTFLRSRKASENAESVLLSGDWWAVLDESLELSSGSSPSPTLPTFVAFVAAYAASGDDEGLVRSVLAVFRRLAGAAMKKATVDAALEGYCALLKASVRVVGRGGLDLAPWEELAELWMKAFRTVVDSGKGGKKVRSVVLVASSLRADRLNLQPITHSPCAYPHRTMHTRPTQQIPLHTLANLPSILALLPVLRPTEPFLPALLQTVQFTLFNVENLRRGIARESYTAAADESESASSELLNALKALLPTQASLGALRWIRS